MGKLVLFMHTTLDGFVAGPGGEMDWIIVDEEMFVYAGQRTSESDTALYGRVTYEMMQAYWPTAAEQPGATQHDIEHSRWYNRVTKVVLSRSLKDSDLPGTKIINENLSKEINQLKQVTGKDILMFGSPSAAHSLMRENLIDDYWLFINPILLGTGIPLFNDIKSKTKLKLLDTISFSSGVVCLHYKKDVQ